jgi:hypothetical protein
MFSTNPETLSMHQEPICFGSFGQRGSCFLIIKPLNVCVGILVVRSNFYDCFLYLCLPGNLSFYTELIPWRRFISRSKAYLMREHTTGKDPSQCRHIVLVNWLSLWDTFHIPFTGSYHFPASLMNCSEGR